ncbi:MAG: RsmD family RNA methyltransferase [Propionibacteriaceae bacterium]|jgi:tRNA/tmRNA/rRNA uracil-C5-methylase (TrmA/RlmC/RlmD family)|nr:RsmD family RNA methyltransferase [Propionibacteriaceae bacterium]
MILRLTTTDVAHGGYCVARHDGIVVFVSGAAPGEVVEAEVVGQRSRQWYARVTHVEQASPDRVVHPWPLSQRTGVGGMDLGHVSVDFGREWKRRVIQAQLARMARLDVDLEVEAAPGDAEWNGLAWRTRVDFRVDDGGRLAMSAAKSHTLVAIDSMPLAHERIQAELASALAEGQADVNPGDTVSYTYASGSGLARRVRAARDSRWGARTSPGPASFVTETVRTPYGNWEYRVSVDGFWQVHREAPSTLVTAVLDAVGDVDGPIWDLYAGAGLFTVPLASRGGGPVTAIEGSAGAVADLRRNAAELDVQGLAGDVGQVLRQMDRPQADVIVCDPPRFGAGQAVVEQMVRLDPRAIVYVACDPAALARDLGLLMSAGYDVAGIRAFDLFPLTHHVECVARLVKPGR